MAKKVDNPETPNVENIEVKDPVVENNATEQGVVNTTANDQLKDELKEKETLEEQLKTPVVATMVDKKTKLVKVKFLENHTFNKGIQKIVAKKGDIHQVEPHLANKFLSRKIAYILG